MAAVPLRLLGERFGAAATSPRWFHGSSDGPTASLLPDADPKVDPELVVILGLEPDQMKFAPLWRLRRALPDKLQSGDVVVGAAWPTIWVLSPRPANQVAVAELVDTVFVFGNPSGRFHDLECAMVCDDTRRCRAVVESARLCVRLPDLLSSWAGQYSVGPTGYRSAFSAIFPTGCRPRPERWRLRRPGISTTARGCSRLVPRSVRRRHSGAVDCVGLGLSDRDHEIGFARRSGGRRATLLVMVTFEQAVAVVNRRVLG